MSSEVEQDREARLAAVECVVEALLAGHFAEMEPVAARQQRTMLMERMMLLARRPSGAPVNGDMTAREALARHALGNLVQKAMIIEGQLRRQKVLLGSA